MVSTITVTLRYQKNQKHQITSKLNKNPQEFCYINSSYKMTPGEWIIIALLIFCRIRAIELKIRTLF